jgi:hypothetical protein
MFLIYKELKHLRISCEENSIVLVSDKMADVVDVVYVNM